MKRGAPGPLLLVLLLVAASVGAEPRFWAPEVLTPGAPNAVYAWDEGTVGAYVVEVWRDGGKSPVATGRAFAPRALPGEYPPRLFTAALIAPDALATAGPVVVRFLSGGRVVAQVHSNLAPRSFPLEVIPLDAAMSELRSKPDARKDREAAAIWRVYGTFHANFAWVGGAFRLPVDLPYRQSAGFGDTREYRYADGTTSRDIHRGVDFAVPKGTPVQAPAAGRVALVADRKLTGWTVVLEHAPGVYSVYFHLSRTLVKVGQLVGPGDPIALSGATGLVTGPHLHWEVKVSGTSVDPFAFVAHGVLDTGAADAVISSIERKRG